MVEENNMTDKMGLDCQLACCDNENTHHADASSLYFAHVQPFKL